MIRSLAPHGLTVAAVLCLSSAIVGCDQGEAKMDCPSVLSQIALSATARAVQPDGSVTIYGAIESVSADAGVERVVRAVYVADQEVSPGANNFNFRSWSISLSRDVLLAHANGSTQAKISVTAYLYGACVAQLAADAEPVVTLPVGDAGAGADGH